MNALDDSANTDRCTLYEDSANFLTDERLQMNALRSLCPDAIKLWLFPNQSLVIVCTQATLYEALTEYQTSANCLKDEHRGHKNYRMS